MASLLGLNWIFTEDDIKVTDDTVFIRRKIMCLLDAGKEWSYYWNNQTVSWNELLINVKYVSLLKKR